MDFETLKSLLAKQLRIEPETITESSNIVEDLGADSIDIVEMLFEIEQRLGITISDEDAITLKTVGDVLAYLKAQGK